MDEMEQQIMFEMSENLQKQKQSTEAIKFQIKELLQSQAKLQAKLIESQKNLETVMPRFFSQTSIPLRPPSQPPDPPDFDKSNLKFDGKLIDGTLLCEWVLRCEQFFMKNNIPPEQKVRIISIHMEGEAFHWHCDFIRNRFGIFPSWSDYIVALSARFGKLFDDPLSELMSLKQCGDSVETYLEKFDRALSRLSLSMPHAVNIFLSNMNPHLASHVKQFDVTTVAYAAWVAKLFEPSLLHTTAIQPRAPFSPYQNQNNQSHDNSPNTSSSLPPLETTKTLPYKPNFPTETNMEKSPRKLYCEEIQESGMRGLCMSSDGSYANGHHLESKKSQIFVMECDDEESSDVREPSDVTIEEIIDKSVDMIQEEKSTPENESSSEVSPQILLSQLRIFDDESQGTLGDHTLAPMKPYHSYSQPWYELETIQSDINFKVLVAHECDMVGAVMIYEVATTFEKLAKTWMFKFKNNPKRSKLMDNMFSFMEKSSEKYVTVWESDQGDGLSLLNCLIAHDVLRLWICLGIYNSSLEAKLELSVWKYKKQINQGQICLNGLRNELVCDKEKKRESSEFNECHNHLKKLQAALEGIPQKIAGGLIYGDVKFHLKHKWRSRLEFCVDNAILFTSLDKLLFTKNCLETGFCTHYNGLKQLRTESQSSPGLDYFAYLIFLWNQALNCGCEAGHISSGFFFVGDVHEFFTCSKLQNGDETYGKRLLDLNEISLLDNDNKVDFTIKANWFYNKPMIREVFHLQRPPELINLQGNPNFITKVLVQWKEHPPDQLFSSFYWQVLMFSSLRTRMFRRGKYCNRINRLTLLV